MAEDSSERSLGTWSKAKTQTNPQIAVALQIVLRFMSVKDVICKHKAGDNGEDFPNDKISNVDQASEPINDETRRGTFCASDGFKSIKGKMVQVHCKSRSKLAECSTSDCPFRDLPYCKPPCTRQCQQHLQVSAQPLQQVFCVLYNPYDKSAQSQRHVHLAWLSPQSASQLGGDQGTFVGGQAANLDSGSPGRDSTVISHEQAENPAGTNATGMLERIPRT
eukprot:snap_masked-scaffold627_size122700-processed-gene-0.12 protein:Tk10653 transcript:snap_masked-scaffold627_size122700-processed-gene-0.12-mRNA-1 annotation:"hypothetical protein AUEXF2481DRAFT_1725"